MYAGTCGETMICAGGTNFPDKPMLEGGAKTWTDRIFTLSPGENGWTEAGTLPAPYAYGASASTREGLLCIGGCGKEGHRKDVYLLSTADGAVTVTPFPPLPIALAYTAAAVLGGKVYLTGGCERPGEQDCTNRVFMLDARGPEQGWQELDPLPGRGRFLHQMAAADGALRHRRGPHPGPGFPERRDLFAGRGRRLRKEVYPADQPRLQQPVPVPGYSRHGMARRRAHRGAQGGPSVLRVAGPFCSRERRT